MTATVTAFLIVSGGGVATFHKVSQITPSLLVPIVVSILTFDKEVLPVNVGSIVAAATSVTAVATVAVATVAAAIPVVVSQPTLLILRQAGSEDPIRYENRDD